MNYKYLTILILIIIIIILIISFGVIFFIKKTKEKYDKISNFENFQTFLKITNDCYYYTSELDFENNTFKKDSSGNFVNTGGDDVNINNILRNNYFNL